MLSCHVMGSNWSEERLALQAYSDLFWVVCCFEATKQPRLFGLIQGLLGLIQAYLGLIRAYLGLIWASSG